MTAILEMEALQNFGDTLDLKINQKYTEDKRQTVNKYFASRNGTSVSPVLNYNELNCYMMGWKNSIIANTPEN